MKIYNKTLAASKNWLLTAKVYVHRTPSYSDTLQSSIVL